MRARPISVEKACFVLSDPPARWQVQHAVSCCEVSGAVQMRRAHGGGGGPSSVHATNRAGGHEGPAWVPRVVEGRGLHLSTCPLVHLSTCQLTT